MNTRIVLMVLSIVLSVLIGITLSRGGASASGASSGTEKIKIGLSLDTLKEARWQADRDLFVKRCEELGAQVEVQSANGDDSQQIKGVGALLTAGVKVLVVVPHDGVAMAQGVEMANKAGVPVISYDRLIKNSDVDLYLSFDNIRVGELQAKYLLEHLPGGKGKIVRIYGAPTDNNAKMFKQGQDNILKPAIDRGDVQVIHEDWAEDWKPENAKKIVNAAITRNGHDFAAVLASNDGTASGAIQSLKEDGVAGKVLVTGQDADVASCQSIAAGLQTMTVYKPLKKLATQAAEIAVKMARGKAVVANGAVNNGKVDVPSVLGEVFAVDKNNMIDTIIKDGFHSYDTVYRDIPENKRPPKP